MLLSYSDKSFSDCQEGPVVGEEEAFQRFRSSIRVQLIGGGSGGEAFEGRHQS